MKVSLPAAIAIFVSLPPSLPAQDSKPARLALISTERSDAIANILTLAEAKLSATAEVEVLERRAIDKVLDEQKLSLAGFVKSDQVLAAGKLLTVDLFAILEADKLKKKAVGLVVFDARTGVRLWDAPMAIAELEQTVAETIAGVRAAAAKVRRQYKDLFTICLTTVRNVDLPRDKDGFCDTVGFLLERGLVTSPTLVLLERSRLDQVNKERNLPRDSPLQQLLASLVRVELEVARSVGGQGLRATALLYGSGGQLLGKPSVTIPRQDAAALAFALLPELTRALKARPASAANRPLEAQRFFQEAEFFRQHKDPLRGLRALEAAVALEPADLKMRMQLANVYFEGGADIIRPYHFGSVFFNDPPPKITDDLRRSLEHFLHGADIMHDLEHAQPGDLSKFVFRYDLLQHYLHSLKSLRKGDTDETRALLHRLRERYQSLVDLYQDRAFATVKDKRSFEAYTVRMGDQFGDLRMERYFGLTDEQQTKNKRRFLPRWLEAARKYGAPPLEPRTIKCAYALLRQLAAMPEADPTPARNYRATLLRDGGVYARLFDEYTELQIRLDREKLTTAQQRQPAVRQFRLNVQKLIQSKEARRDRSLTYLCYMTIFEATDLLRGFSGYKQPKGQEMAELCRFMLDQNDLVISIAGMTLFSLKDFTREGDMKAWEFIDPLLTLIDAPHAHLLAPDDVLKKPYLKQHHKTTFKNMLRENRQALVRKYPELERQLVTPWTHIDELIDVAGAKKGIFRLLRPIVHEGSVYVLGMGQESDRKGQYLQLLRFSLADGQKTALGRIDVAHRHAPHTDTEFDLGLRFLFAPAACIHDGRYYLGSSFLGIFVFPLDGGPIERLYTKNILPSDYVQDLACVDGKLYAALGEENKEGYLAAIDLDTHRCKIVASSRRKEKLSPFDDSPPFFARGFLADPKRHRVLFLASVRNQLAPSGLWEINSVTGKLRQRMKHYLFSPYDLEWYSLLSGDKILLASKSATIVYDLATDKWQSRPYKNTDIVQTQTYVLPRLKDVLALAQPGKEPIPLRGGDMLFDGWLWSSDPFGRVSLDGEVKERFPRPRKKFNRFNPNECMQVLDNGSKLLFADQNGIWLANRLAKNRAIE
jgi:hypothetical protein